jgi:tight adherence protein B
MVLALLTFLFTLSITFLAYWMIVARPEARASARLRERLQIKAAGPAVPSSLVKGGGIDALGGGILARYQHRVLLHAATLVEDAGMQVDPRRVVVGTAAMLFLMVASLRAVDADWVVALAAGLMTPLAPFVFFRYRARKRLAAFEEHFPEAIDLMARALRAGHAFTTTIAMVAEESREPVRSEFRRVYEQHNYGLPLPQVLRALAARNPLIDVRFFVTAVLTQRETGGNLAEVLDHLAAATRDRFRVRRQLRVLTAQGRMTGWVLAAFPIGLALVLYVMNPQHMNMFLQDPAGVRMLMGAGILQVVGTMLIRKIVAVEY